jgi:hypothetical protein
VKSSDFFLSLFNLSGYWGSLSVLDGDIPDQISSLGNIYIISPVSYRQVQNPKHSGGGGKYLNTQKSAAEIALLKVSNIFTP